MIAFSALPINATLLAPSHLHPLLRKELLRTSHGKIGLRLSSLTGYLASLSLEEQSSQAIVLFQYRNIVKTFLPTLENYQEAALTPVFLKACHQFIDEMKQWGISPASLSEDTPAHAELKRILTQLFPVPSHGDQIHHALSLLKQKEASSIYIYDTFFSSFDQWIVDLLVKQGATLLKDEQQPKNCHFFHAVNKRQEIEACAQYILNQNLHADDIAITLADGSYAPLFKQLFDRYQIPFTDMHNTTTTSIAMKRIGTLLSYYQKPDTAHLYEVLSSGVFKHEQLTSLLAYLQIYQADFFQPFDHLQQLNNTSHILNAVDLLNLAELESRAEEARLAIAEQLLPLRQPISYEQLLLSSLTLVRVNLPKVPTETAAFTKIQELMAEAYPYLQEKEDITFLSELLEDIRPSAAITNIQGVIVTGLLQGTVFHKHHFLLGVTQGNYPAFPTKSGIFDEVYYETLCAYPDMEQRYQHHLRQLEKLLNHSDTIIASYPLGTYEGKSLEAALEIEQRFPRALPYPLASHHEQTRVSATLSKDHAKALYVSDQKIYGSISAIERYVKCPFSYFLRYGLGLREPMKLGFADSYMGTLSHYLMETLVKEMGKQYAETAETTIASLIETEIAALQEVFPDMEARLSILRSRIEDGLSQTMKRLEEFERHSRFQPWKQEQEFEYNITVEEDISLALRGIIDRLDTYEDMACILDYKSSAKTLSETNVFAAMQLQLLTYSIVIQKQEHKEIAGAYYVSLKNENIPQPAGTLRRRKPVSWEAVEKEELQSTLQKTHRINGWTMQPNVALLDDDGQHIKGVRQTKDGIIKAAKVYDIHSIEKWFTSMYQNIAKRMLDGDIAIEPSQDACLYCDFHEICRYHGLPFERNPLVEVDDTLYRKGEEEDA